jgi:hypothetical protein
MREPTEDAWIADWKAQGGYHRQEPPIPSGSVSLVAKLWICTVWVVGTVLGGCVLGGLGALVLWSMR